VAHDDFLDVFDWNLGSLEGFPDGDGAELGRAEGRKRSQEFPDWSSGGANDYGCAGFIGHGYFVYGLIYVLKLTGGGSGGHNYEGVTGVKESW
jgi:hypothetical protein